MISKSIEQRIERLEELRKEREKINKDIHALKKKLSIDRREINRPKLISFRVTNHEFEQIKELCREHKISRTKLIHEIVFGEIERLAGGK